MFVFDLGKQHKRSNINEYYNITKILLCYKTDNSATK